MVDCRDPWARTSVTRPSQSSGIAHEASPPPAPPEGRRDRLLTAGQADGQRIHRIVQRQVPGGMFKRPLFLTLDDTRQKMEHWRRDLHSAIGNKVPTSLMNGSGASHPSSPSPENPPAGRSKIWEHLAGRVANWIDLAGSCVVLGLLRSPPRRATKCES
jgi:hypothetical protein